MGNTNSTDSNPGCCFAFKNSAAKAGQMASDEFASFWKETKNNKAFLDFAFYTQAWLIKEFKVVDKFLVEQLTDLLIKKVKPYIVQEAIKYDQMSPLVNVLFNTLNISKGADDQFILNKINEVNDGFVQYVTKTVSDLGPSTTILTDANPLLLTNPQKLSLPASQSTVVNLEPINSLPINDEQSKPLTSSNNAMLNDQPDLSKRSLPSVPR